MGAGGNLDQSCLKLTKKGEHVNRPTSLHADSRFSVWLTTYKVKNTCGYAINNNNDSSNDNDLRIDDLSSVTAEAM